MFNVAVLTFIVKRMDALITDVRLVALFYCMNKLNMHELFMTTRRHCFLLCLRLSCCLYTTPFFFFQPPLHSYYYCPFCPLSYWNPLFVGVFNPIHSPIFFFLSSSFLFPSFSSLGVNLHWCL